MKFEKLNENKLRITLNIRDLEDKNINYQSFMSNSVDTQKLFSDMLDKAEKEIGFVTRDYKLMIEALVTSKGDFVITVTRSNPDDDYNHTKKYIRTKRKSIPNVTNQAIYSFNNFEDFCSFCNYLDNDIVKNINKISNTISLYLYKNKYYLLIHNFNTNYIFTKKFTTQLVDFAKFIHSPDIFEYKLLEYGNLVIKNNAIKNCLKYFK